MKMSRFCRSCHEAKVTHSQARAFCRPFISLIKTIRGLKGLIRGLMGLIKLFCSRQKRYLANQKYDAVDNPLNAKKPQNNRDPSGASLHDPADESRQEVISLCIATSNQCK